MSQLNVSRGQPLHFAANGVEMDGFILRSTKATFGAGVVVETESAVPLNAQLIVPGTDCGGCGLATPHRVGKRTQVMLEIGYGSVDQSTVGK